MAFPAGYPGLCPDCGTQREVSGTYEAVFCPLCDEWQSPLCGQCAACHDRPERPSESDDLDLAPHAIDPDYDLNTDNEAELLRRVVLPVVRGTLPENAVRRLEITQTDGIPECHWPPDVPVPNDVSCQLTLVTGEQLVIYLSQQGDVNPQDVAEMFAGRLEDDWSESSMGWGQQVHSIFQVPAPEKG